MLKNLFTTSRTVNVEEILNLRGEKFPLASEKIPMGSGEIPPNNVIQKIIQ